MAMEYSWLSAESICGIVGNLSIGMLPDLLMLLIVAIAWIYVVLMMAITEHSVIAGIMTFLFYCVLPLIIILYLLAAPQRLRRRKLTARLATVPQSDGFEQSTITSIISSPIAPQHAPAGTHPDAGPERQPPTSE